MRTLLLTLCLSLSFFGCAEYGRGGTDTEDPGPPDAAPDGPTDPPDAGPDAPPPCTGCECDDSCPPECDPATECCDGVGQCCDPQVECCDGVGQCCNPDVECCDGEGVCKPDCDPREACCDEDGVDELRGEGHLEHGNGYGYGHCNNHVEP